MNQIEIGRFIAAQRKANKMTQQQLAEALGVSNKTVSKWECGYGFPDVSLIQPLCNRLNICVDELLDGQRRQVNSTLGADKQLMTLLDERSKLLNRQHRLMRCGVVISVIAFILIVLTVAVYTRDMSLWVKGGLVAIFGVIMGVSILSTIFVELSGVEYRCPACANEFKPSALQALVARRLLGTATYRCPNCKKRIRSGYSKFES